MSDDWRVFARTEQVTAIIFVGERNACEDLVDAVLGKPLVLICAGGEPVESGTITKAWASPPDPKRRTLQ